MNTMNGKEVYSTKEVAEITKRAIVTVNKWIEQGKLNATKVHKQNQSGPDRWRVTKADLDKFLADRHIQESFVQNEAGVKTIPSTLIYRDKIRAMIEDAIRAEIQRAVKEAVSSVMNDIIAA